MNIHNYMSLGHRSTIDGQQIKYVLEPHSAVLFEIPTVVDCDDPNMAHLSYDFNTNCNIDFGDILEIVDNWLKCNGPDDPNCL